MKVACLGNAVRFPCFVAPLARIFIKMDKPFETECSAYSAAIRAASWLDSEQFCLELRWCCSICTMPLSRKEVVMGGTNYQYSSAEDDFGYSCDSCGTTWSAALYGTRCPNGCEDTDDTCVSPLPPFLDEETHYLIPPYYGRACRTGEPLVTL